MCIGAGLRGGSVAKGEQTMYQTQILTTPNASRTFDRRRRGARQLTDGRSQNANVLQLQRDYGALRTDVDELRKEVQSLKIENAVDAERHNAVIKKLDELDKDLKQTGTDMRKFETSINRVGWAIILVIVTTVINIVIANGLVNVGA